MMRTGHWEFAMVILKGGEWGELSHSNVADFRSHGLVSVAGDLDLSDSE